MCSFLRKFFKQEFFQKTRSWRVVNKRWQNKKLKYKTQCKTETLGERLQNLIFHLHMKPWNFIISYHEFAKLITKPVTCCSSPWWWNPFFLLSHVISYVSLLLLRIIYFFKLVTALRGWPHICSKVII